jgi:hypothetical protein
MCVPSQKRAIVGLNACRFPIINAANDYGKHGHTFCSGSVVTLVVPFMLTIHILRRT